MPIKHAAEKALRQSKKANIENREVRETIKKILKTNERALAAGKIDEVKASLPKLAQLVDKAAKMKVIKPNKANRIKSRFAAKVKKAATK